MKTGFSLSPGLTGIWKRRKVVFIIGTLVVAFNVFFLLRHFITIRRTKTAIQSKLGYKDLYIVLLTFYMVLLC